MTETALSSAIREALLATGKVLLWRNNTGKLQDRTGRWVTYGIGVGGADLVGILRRSLPALANMSLPSLLGRVPGLGLAPIVADLVVELVREAYDQGVRDGQQSGRFTAWEVKTPDGKLSPEQRAWHAVVTAAGGAVFTARSVDEAMGQLRSLGCVIGVDLAYPK
jgi:hypothetical protein